jgi:lipoprotein-anchoring transpeptidase ErfK/SrfK
MDNTDEELEEMDADAGVQEDAGTSEAPHLYSLHDVPWTQFFFENYAIHGVYWHDGFGNRRSHGCINMSPTDAKWLYEWTEPKVPQGWWAIQSSPENRGTLIHVR